MRPSVVLNTCFVMTLFKSAALGAEPELETAPEDGVEAVERSANGLEPHALAVVADRPAGTVVAAVGIMLEFYYPRAELQLSYRAASWFEARGRVATNGLDWNVELDTLWGLWGGRHFGFALSAHIGVNTGAWTAVEPDVNVGVGAVMSFGSPGFRFTLAGDFYGVRLSLLEAAALNRELPDVSATWRAVLGFDWHVGDDIAMYCRAQLRIGSFDDFAGVLPQVSLGVSW